MPSLVLLADSPAQRGLGLADGAPGPQIRDPSKHLLIGTRRRRSATTTRAVEARLRRRLDQLKAVWRRTQAPLANCGALSSAISGPQISGSGVPAGQFLGAYPA
jgi:hypothetical protein